MKNNENSSFWISAHIITNPTLEEAIVDYLVGVMGASVEQSVDVKGPALHLNTYLKEKNPTSETQQLLRNQLECYLTELATIFQVEKPIISWKRIEDQDWSNNWKVHFKPFAITEGLIIAPTWEEYTAQEGERVIIMDPGMAFGTGHHATTSLTLDFIRQILAHDKDQRILDVGTGTGILGMGAALFGATHVLGIDNDPEAVRVALENVSLNNLDSVMDVSHEPLQQIKGSFNLIVANIIHDALITMTDSFSNLLVREGNLVLSGILHGEQEKNIIRVFTGCGFLFTEKKQRKEWVALHFTKTD
ncbi:(LSU ribosomal protein L11P)-lysine N-methyltransferase [Desulfocapsa sulfexigens DSM 10523]|uniref:Ribosomal protein L11 methyltransferase n=1 Tax=Desulfocapsa sulfexigens (strain DSM 10523 / SB164P1) TaxID=1167006 RepID=M1PMM9_DESSD|nr:50S ribosomal protein L11 methyltransferase [Desulfocapsa sulfexigens]AGF77706.1 (LSU ribosomal protein L11P)-lysine N-methyltransferase [Desulfocapsa sulfexigens DSM 10523]